MDGLTNLERETIINYNQAEKEAVCFTRDPALIRKLDKLVASGEAITVTKEGDDFKGYTFPKKCIKVRFPRHLTEEQRQAMASRMRGRKDEK